MENTPNAGLKRWDPEDRILLDDFNENWGKIDDKLATLGNCRVEYGSYTGDGDTSSAMTLTFDGKPLLVIVGSYSSGILFLMRGAQVGLIFSHTNGVKGTTPSWTETSVTYSDSPFKYKGGVYPYIAFFEKDA